MSWRAKSTADPLGRNHQVNRGLIQELAGVEDASGVEASFQGLMNGPNYVASRLRPPSFLCQADAVFSCDHPTPIQNLSKKLIQHALHFRTNSRITVIPISHDVDMYISITSMTEACDRKT